MIKNEKDYDQYLSEVDKMFDLKLDGSSQEGKILQMKLTLIQQYEDAHYPIPEQGLLKT